MENTVLIKKTILRGSFAFALVAYSACAFAQDTYPSKPVTIIVPFSPGGGVDSVARLLADKLKNSLKQTVLVENKPGGSGMIGANAVAKASPDGLTLLLGSAGETAINPHVYKNRMQYRPEKDLAPITLIAKVPNVLVVNSAFTVKNIEELVSYAKKNPGKVTYSSSGVGNLQHLNGELLKAMADIDIVHVPYKGAAGQLTDVVSGEVNMTFVSYAATKGFIQNGKVRAIAVTSAKRADFAPAVPAVNEFKPLANYQLENWFGLFAPAGTPTALQEKIHAAVVSALKDPELERRLREQGAEVSPTTPQQFRDFIAGESTKFRRIVEDAKVTME